MRKSIRHEFVKIFGGIYYDNKNHEIANAYGYAGAVPLWIKCAMIDIRMWLILRWYDLKILYYTTIIKIRNEK
jgi:hypothetical protein